MANIINKLIRSVALTAKAASADFYRKRGALAIRSELNRRSLMSSVDFIETQMGEALYTPSRLAHLGFVCQNLQDGVALEFGVYRGETINHMSKLLKDRQIYGFDSFLGLPEQWGGNRASNDNFNVGGAKPVVGLNVSLVDGWFDQTLPEFLASFDGEIALVHIDCDIYSSTVTVLELLAERIKPGCRIVFDEFFNYPGYAQHEYKAFFEFVEKYKVEYSFLAYSGQQVSLVVNSINGLSL